MSNGRKMTVSDLIKELKKLNPKLEVVVSDYDEPDKKFAFAYVSCVRKEAINVGDHDKDFAYIYSGDWLWQGEGTDEERTVLVKGAKRKCRN